MYFRSLTTQADITVSKFTLDAHSEAGYRGNQIPAIGQPISDAGEITMYPVEVNEGTLSENRLRAFIQDCSESLA